MFYSEKKCKIEEYRKESTKLAVEANSIYLSSDLR
jgi:hypothetical protein